MGGQHELLSNDDLPALHSILGTDSEDSMFTPMFYTDHSLTS